MRTLTFILALLGGVWALTGIGGLMVTFSSLEHVESASDLFNFFATMILLTSGYYVWWGWVSYSFKARFPFVSPLNFWLISLIHHVLCVIYLLPFDVWGGGDDPWWITVWIILNVVIAAYTLVKKPWVREGV